MTERTSKLIAALLAGILAVLLFGREAVLGAVWVVPLIFGAMLALWAAYIFLRSFLGVFVDDYRKEKSKGQATVFSIIGYIALAANMVAVTYGLWLSWSSGGSEQMWSTPYMWAPIGLFIVSYGLHELTLRWRRRRRKSQDRPF